MRLLCMALSLSSSDLYLYFVSDEIAMVDVHISLEIISDCLFCDILNYVVRENLIVQAETSEVVREDESPSRGEMHCCCLDKAGMVSLHIEVVSS